MKYLILAACLCLASAAPQFGSFGKQAKPVAKTVAKAAVTAGAVVASPFVAAADVTVQGAKYASGAASSYVAGKDVDVPIVKSVSDVRADGYEYSWEAGNGISAEASGVLKKVEDHEALVSQGGYRYTAPDGTPVEFQYIADENGYQPQSPLIPTPPPVPVAIARSLEYIAAHPHKEVQ